MVIPQRIHVDLLYLLPRSASTLRGCHQAAANKLGRNPVPTADGHKMRITVDIPLSIQLGCNERVCIDDLDMLPTMQQLQDHAHLQAVEAEQAQVVAGPDGSHQD